jgi:hypothetical protein
MKRRTFRDISLVTGFVAMFAAIPAWAGVESTPFRTGFFGITAGQAIRVSVLNAQDDGGITGPCVNPDLLLPAVRIRNLAGALLFEARGEPLACGRGTFVDFAPALNDGAQRPTGAPTPGTGVVPASAHSRRIQIRAELEFVDQQSQKVQKVRSGEVVLTLEVFDTATGRTVFTMPFAAVAFNPQPEPPEPVQTSAR